jgi:hypothetical protein
MAKSLTASELEALSDDELFALEDLVDAEKRRRWELRRPRTFVEDIRAGLQAPTHHSQGE